MNVKVLEELQKDPWPVPSDQRATRCTGTALSVAASLLGACVPGSGARIMAFIGGPSTEGLGAVSALLFSIRKQLSDSLLIANIPYYPSDWLSGALIMFQCINLSIKILGLVQLWPSCPLDTR